MPVPTLPDVKSQLAIDGAEHDELLVRYLNASLRLIEARVGPSSVVAKSEVVTGHGEGINLSYRPLVTVDTLTPLLDSYPSFVAADVAFDPRAGTVWRKDLGTLVGTWTVDYTAGWVSFPDNYYLATLVTVQHLWRTRRGGAKRPSMGNADDLTVTFGSSMSRVVKNGNTVTLPAAALELLGDSIFYGGIA